MTPVLPVATYPRIRHTAEGVWSTLCERCKQPLSSTHVGGVASEHATHIWKEHHE